MPAIEGGGQCSEAIWTSADALTSSVLPASMVVVGAGVVGMECASLFAPFGTEVTLIDSADRSFADAPAEIRSVLSDALQRLGVDIRYGVEASKIRFADADRGPEGGVVVSPTDGTDVSADRVLVAIGRQPATTGFGLERLGVNPEAPLPLEPNGRVGVDGSVWAIGDVAGQGQYTHLANHHARVVADHLVGTGTRRFDDVVLPRCMFTDPPLMQVGPQWAELRDDPDVVDVGVELDTVPRAATDELDRGHLWLAARRSTGCLVATAGAGPRFDELTRTLVVAIDGNVPVARLRRSMQPFPTIGELLGPAFDELHSRLAS